MIWCAHLSDSDSRGGQRVDRQAFIELPVALQRRLLRAILRDLRRRGTRQQLSRGGVSSACLSQGKERGPAVFEAGPRDPGTGVGAI